MYTWTENQTRQNQVGVRSEQDLVAIRSRVRIVFTFVNCRTVSANNEFKVQQNQDCVKSIGFSNCVVPNYSPSICCSIQDPNGNTVTSLFVIHQTASPIYLHASLLLFLIASSPITSWSARKRSSRRSGFIRNFLIPEFLAFSSVMV